MKRLFTIGGLAALGCLCQGSLYAQASVALPNDTLVVDNDTEFFNDDVYLQTDSINFAPKRKNIFSTKNEPLSYMGSALVLEGLYIKSHKEGIRNMRNYFVPEFQHSYDNYTQYAPFVSTYILKAAGVEGHSSWGRLVTSNAMSFATMALLVNSIKYTAREMRPDNSTRNSFPSGHTATAFVCATILHKEYGMTRSPWYSVAGYGVAAATGISRILNHRHWISDVMVGAGIGVLSTNIGYLVTDIIMKDKGLLRPYRKSETRNFLDKSFYLNFGVQAELSDFNSMDYLDLSDKSEDFIENGFDIQACNLHFGTVSSVGLEAAYFPLKHLGVGVSAKAASMPVVPHINPAINWSGLKTTEANTPVSDFVDKGLTFSKMELDYVGMLRFGAGLYGRFNLTPRIELIPKALLGYQLSSDGSIGAVFTPKTQQLQTFKQQMGEERAHALLNNLGEPVENGSYYMDDYLHYEIKNTMYYNLGLMLTYNYASNMSVSLNLDYNHMRPKTRMMIYNWLNDEMVPSEGAAYDDERPNMDRLSIGLGMTVAF